MSLLEAVRLFVVCVPALACAGGSAGEVGSATAGVTSVAGTSTGTGVASSTGEGATGTGGGTGSSSGGGSGGGSEAMLTGGSSSGPGPDLPQEPAGECHGISGWSATEPFADADHVSHPLPSFARGGFYYVHTMLRADASQRRLLFAAIGPEGAPGPWQEASPDHGGGPHGFTAVVAGGEAHHFRNGHIARYVFAPDGTMVGDVMLLEDSPDTAFGGNKYVWDSAVFAPLPGAPTLIHLGGFSFTGYTYRPDVYRSPVPLAASFSDTGLDHPSGQRPGKAAFYAPPAAAGGFVFTGRGDGPELWRSEVAAEGGPLGFEALGDLPPGTDNERGDLFVAGRTLFAVRGAAVHRADLGLAGELGPWSAAASLPEAQIDVHWGEGHAEGAAYGIVDSYVYLTGPKRVLFASLEPRGCEI